jgi:hypothetical protein
MKNHTQHSPWSKSEIAALWIFRFLMLAVPTLALYGAWELSAYLFVSETAIERIMYWLATVTALGFMLMTLQFLTIDLPRMKRRAKFWAGKKLNN